MDARWHAWLGPEYRPRAKEGACCHKQFPVLKAYVGTLLTALCPSARIGTHRYINCGADAALAFSLI
eukprot:5458956-Pleurochrysis_carterae.AAC.5